jgi:hypothetical protein
MRGLFCVVAGVALGAERFHYALNYWVPHNIANLFPVSCV